MACKWSLSTIGSAGIPPAFHHQDRHGDRSPTLTSDGRVQCVGAQQLARVMSPAARFLWVFRIPQRCGRRLLASTRRAGESSGSASTMSALCVVITIWTPSGRTCKSSTRVRRAPKWMAISVPRSPAGPAILDASRRSGWPGSAGCRRTSGWRRTFGLPRLVRCLKRSDCRSASRTGSIEMMPGTMAANLLHQFLPAIAGQVLEDADDVGPVGLEILRRTRLLQFADLRGIDLDRLGSCADRRHQVPGESACRKGACPGATVEVIERGFAWAAFSRSSGRVDGCSVAQET